MRTQLDRLRQWLVYTLMTFSLGAAVLLRGGRDPRQWEWCALAISAAAVLALLPGRKWAGSQSWTKTPRERFGCTVLMLLLGWLLLQMTPLPPAMLAHLAPQRWADVEAARAAAGGVGGEWAALSVAPAATFERLLVLLPAMAALITAREMGWWWRARIWVAFAPVVGVAWLESLAGLAQFTAGRWSPGAGTPVMASGTYVYHNHFAGLLELGLPVAAMWAVWEWRQGSWQRQQSLGPGLRAAGLAGVAACLLAGILASLSRMGFLSTLGGAALTGMAVAASRAIRPAQQAATRARTWTWAAPVAAAVCALALLAPKELLARFAELDLSQDSRAQMWSDTERMIHGSAGVEAWVGVGAGAFEQGLYRYKTAMPLKTVDFAHNDYLQCVAELGVAGAALAGVIGLWVLARAAAIVVWMGRNPNWEFAVGVLGALLTLGLHSLADFNFYLPANVLAMAWLAGLAVSPGLKGR